MILLCWISKLNEFKDEFAWFDELMEARRIKT